MSLLFGPLTEEPYHDPVHFHAQHHDDDPDGWYFWDETWGERHGPFRCELEANEALLRYCREYLGEGNDQD